MRNMIAAAVAILSFLVSTPASAQQLVPNRLSSVGDSISEGVNAEAYNLFNPANPNHWASWTNGYHGFWEAMLGRTDVYSHNQRISANFGSSGRANYMESLSGADSYDLGWQTQQSVDHQATYVTWFMGHNDVCQGSFADIPTDAEFEANVREGLENLSGGLPNGATIYVVGLVDIYQLYQLGSEMQSLGIMSCETLWATSLLDWYPCGTMLSPANSEADRQYTRSRNIAFNQILQDLVAEYSASDPRHFYAYSDAAWNYSFQPSQVSGFDCFHPSASGQRELSRMTWQSGPFSAYTR